MIVDTILWAAIVLALGVVAGVVTALILRLFFVVTWEEKQGPVIDWKPSATSILKGNLTIVAVVCGVSLLLKITLPWPIIRWVVVLPFVLWFTAPTGINMGIELYAASKVGVAKIVVAALVPHGIFELPAAAGIFGHCLALSLSPGRTITPETCVTIGALTTVLIVAAFIESYISPRVALAVAERMGIEV